MQITICLIIMQIWHSCQSYSVVISIHMIFNVLNAKRNSHVKCICHCICHCIVKLHCEGKNRIGETWNRRTKMHTTMYYHYTHWTVCMYVYCLLPETVIVNVNCECWFYMNCYFDICCNCMNIDLWMDLDEYMCNIFDNNNSSSFVFNIVKEPVPSVIRVYPTPFYYTGDPMQFPTLCAIMVFMQFMSLRLSICLWNWFCNCFQTGITCQLSGEPGYYPAGSQAVRFQWNVNWTLGQNMRAPQ